MELFLGFIGFMKVFVLMMSILYVLRIIFNIIKVSVLQEGKVEFGKYGLIWLGLAISYILTVIIC